MKTKLFSKRFKKFLKMPVYLRFAGLICCVFVFLLSSPVQASGISEAKSLQEAFNNVAEKAFPSVVVITTKKEIERKLPPFIEQFFEYYGKKRGKERPPVIEGKGSGFFISEDGYVVTNHHVVAEMDEIIVQTKDRKEYKAELKGSDPKTDVALLKVNASEKFPILEFADSEKVKIGDWAIAIGAPYNLDYTMTVGIVSHTGRTVGLNAYENYIQTDASINRGNSGGPLLDIEGKVIGINDFIFTSGMSEGNIGLGFAIPSNMAKDVVEQLKTKGEVVRPWVGIAMEALDKEMKEQFNAEEGVLVREVFSGDPADKAGIEPGDIILSIDGVHVDTPRDVQMEVLKKKPGDTLKFKLLRNGKEIEKEVIPELQDSSSASLGPINRANEKLLADIGISLSEKNGSIVIDQVFPNSNAEIAGLKAGMEILAVNKQKVSAISDITKAIDKKKQSSILFYVNTGKGKAFIVVKLPK